MAITFTQVWGTKSSSAQATVTFNTSQAGPEVVVHVCLYDGPVDETPTQERDWDLSETRPTEEVQMNANYPNLNGILTLNGNIVTFQGEMYRKDCVKIGLDPIVVAVLD